MADIESVGTMTLMYLRGIVPPQNDLVNVAQRRTNPKP
jgi:hypothetical protein